MPINVYGFTSQCSTSTYGSCAQVSTSFTCDRVQTLLGHMVVLVHPFPVAFEVYLRGRSSLAGKFDRSVFHYEGVLWLALEFRQRFSRGRWKWVWENFTVIAAIYKNRQREVRTCVQFIHKHVSVTANEFGLRGNGETVCVCWERLGPWHFKCTVVIQHLLSKASLGSPHRAKMKVGELDLPLKRASDHTLSPDIFPVTDPSQHRAHPGACVFHGSAPRPCHLQHDNAVNLSSIKSYTGYWLQSEN